jgi:hypothetical protein
MSFSAVGIGTRTFTRDAIVVRGTVSTLTVTAASGTVYSGITSASGVTRFTAHSDGAAWWVG